MVIVPCLYKGPSNCWLNAPPSIVVHGGAPSSLVIDERPSLMFSVLTPLLVAMVRASFVGDGSTSVGEKMHPKFLVDVGDGKSSTLFLPLACDLSSLLLDFGLLYGYRLLASSQLVVVEHQEVCISLVKLVETLKLELGDSLEKR